MAFYGFKKLPHVFFHETCSLEYFLALVFMVTLFRWCDQGSEVTWLVGQSGCDGARMGVRL